MPADAVPVVIAAGLSIVDVKLFGPLHEYDVAFVALPVRVTLSPAQTEADDKLALTDVGATVQPRSIVTIADCPVIKLRQPATDVALSIV